MLKRTLLIATFVLIAASYAQAGTFEKWRFVNDKDLDSESTYLDLFCYYDDNKNKCLALIEDCRAIEKKNEETIEWCRQVERQSRSKGWID